MNLALGRLFAREQQFDKAVQYYHNAIYGLWASDPEVKRRTTQLELIEFLLQHKAYPQAQAELTSMASALPRDPSLRLQVAELLVRAQDNEHAFSQYQLNVWLGGIKLPHARKLAGHSDADVALHALTDAILGALADGDIGVHFPQR